MCQNSWASAARTVTAAPSDESPLRGRFGPLQPFSSRCTTMFSYALNAGTFWLLHRFSESARYRFPSLMFRNPQESPLAAMNMPSRPQSCFWKKGGARARAAVRSLWTYCGMGAPGFGVVFAFVGSKFGGETMVTLLKAQAGTAAAIGIGAVGGGGGGADAAIGAGGVAATQATQAAAMVAGQRRSALRIMKVLRKEGSAPLEGQGS